MNKLESLKNKLQDERSRKMILLSHCILNENSRYLGGAFRKGTIDEIVDLIQSKNIGIIQMDCPEQAAWGGVLKPLLWISVGNKDSFIFKLRRIIFPLFMLKTKRTYKKIAKRYVKLIEDYLQNDYNIIGVVGIDGSPSCGSSKILDLYQFELLADFNTKDIQREVFNEFLYKKLLIKGEGIFIQEMKKILKQKRIMLNFYSHNIIDEMNGIKAKLNF